MNSLQAHRAGLSPLILSIRGQVVILDADLAVLYGVPTKRLNEQVKRNAERFPSGFVFQLSSEEKADVVANCDHLSRLKFSKTCPYAFTEHGALMAANVLSSPEAVKMSVHVVRAFIKQRELLLAHADVLKKLAQMDAKRMKHDEALRAIWQVFNLHCFTRHQLLATRNGPKPLSSFRLPTSSFFNALFHPKRKPASMSEMNPRSLEPSRNPPRHRNKIRNSNKMNLNVTIRGTDPTNKLSEHELLDHSGKISAEQAKMKAELEYERYRVFLDSQPRLVDLDFEKATAELKKLPRQRKPKPPKP